MRHVGIERGAEERQPAGDGRLHVGAEAERSSRHFRHTRKAAVQFDGVELLAVAADEVHHGFQHGVLRMAFIELVAHQIIAWLFGRRAAARIDQPLLCYPRRAGFCQ